jgi:hypothetical protein
VGQYDIAIVGANLGGLASAALLGVKGKKSFLCTPRSSLADTLGKVEQEGFAFFRCPSLSYGFEPGGAYHQLFADLNITNAAPTLADGYQIALPDRRITVSPHIDATLEELRREFPREIKAIKNFYLDMNNVSINIAKHRYNAIVLRFRSAKSLIAKYRFSREFLSFLDIQALFFFHKPILELSLKDLLLLCTHKPFRNDDGCGKIAERLAEVILRQGGTIRYNDTSTEILPHNNRVIGLQTTQGAVEASSILVDNPENVMPALFLGIHDQVVPASMERDVLYLPDYLQPRSFLYLSLSSKEDHTTAPDGMRSLTVAFNVPKEGAIHNRDLLISRISSLVPFLGDFLVLSREPGPLLEPVVPKEISFKPLKTGKSASLLLRGSQRNVYKLRDLQDAPQIVLPAVRKLISKLS